MVGVGGTMKFGERGEVAHNHRVEVRIEMKMREWVGS